MSINEEKFNELIHRNSTSKMMTEFQNYMTKMQSMEGEFEDNDITDVAIDSNVSIVVEIYTPVGENNVVKMFLPYFDGVLKTKDGNYINTEDLEFGFFINDGMSRALSKWVFEKYNNTIETYLDGDKQNGKSWRDLWNGIN